MNLSDLTICITVYKKSFEEIKRLLESIPTECKVLVSFDGGWDTSYGDSELNQIRRCSVEYMGVNLGLAKLRNHQLYNKVKTKYIQFVDADDTVNKRAYEYLGEDFDFAVSPVNLVYEKESVIEFRNIRASEGNGQTYFVIPSIIFNTEFLISNGLRFDESKYLYEDVIFSTKLSLIKAKIQRIYTSVYNYFCDIEGSLSHPKNNTRIIESTIYVMQKLTELSKLNCNQSVVYSRLVEESIRVLSMDLDKETKLKVLNMIKPYKFNGFLTSYNNDR